MIDGRLGRLYVSGVVRRKMPSGIREWRSLDVAVEEALE
jgi:hypothetical protein